MVLEPDDKLTIVLKGVTNHVAHLDIEICEEIQLVRKEMNVRFGTFDSEIDNVQKHVSGLQKDVSELRNDVSDVRNDRIKEISEIRKDMTGMHKSISIQIIEVHQAFNNQIWKIVGALSLIGAAATMSN